jgi:HAD superfamily hydrolase (TIGR01549 family)
MDKTPQIRTFMFDLDNTLIHSTIDFVKLKRKTIDFYSGLGVPNDSLSPTMKTYELTEKATAALTKKGLTAREVTKITQNASRLWNHVELENVEKIRAVAGARETLQTLKNRNVKVGVVTRSCRKYALTALQTVGLLEFVDIIVARDDCANHKPDPEPLVQGLTLLGSTAEETVMVGDSLDDFHCSENAKVRFIGFVTETDPLNTLRRTRGVKLISSLRDLIGLLP